MQLSDYFKTEPGNSSAFAKEVKEKNSGHGSNLLLWTATAIFLVLSVAYGWLPEPILFIWFIVHFILSFIKPAPNKVNIRRSAKRKHLERLAKNLLSKLDLKKNTVGSAVHYIVEQDTQVKKQTLKNAYGGLAMIAYFALVITFISSGVYQMPLMVYLITVFLYVGITVRRAAQKNIIVTHDGNVDQQDELLDFSENDYYDHLMAQETRFGIIVGKVFLFSHIVVTVLLAAHQMGYQL